MNTEHVSTGIAMGWVQGVSEEDSDEPASYRDYGPNDLTTFVPRRANMPSRTRLPAPPPELTFAGFLKHVGVGGVLGAFVICAWVIGAAGLGCGKPTASSATPADAVAMGDTLAIVDAAR
jgi:hypothetical protein